MNLQALFLKSFRNIEKTGLVPDPGFNILWGDNAQGKTNLLEAIYLLGNLKSFRGARTQELVSHGASISRIAGEIKTKGVTHRVEMTLGERGRSASLDGKEIRKAAGFFGHITTVIFAPEEVNLLKGYPAGRRALLDRAVFQADSSYLGRAQEYERCLKQRNRLLKEGRPSREIAPWTESLIRAGARLRRDRSLYLRRVGPLFRETYRNIAGERELADFQYFPHDETEEDFREALCRELEKERERESRLGQTLAGPHRDDPEWLINGRSVRLFGSQGQQRSLILAFKTAQILDLEEQTGEPPVLLLDDMTSELDRQRQGFFFRFLLSRRGQVFITTTDVQPLLQAGLGNARYFRVSNGAFTEKVP